jgi:hypothetical protein
MFSICLSLGQTIHEERGEECQFLQEEFPTDYC